MPSLLAPPADDVTLARPVWRNAFQEPTPASEWQLVAGTVVGDELLQWPPDLFALTEVVLQRSEAFRFALSPAAGSIWPPAGVPDWPDAVTDAARRWSDWIEDRAGPVPRLLAGAWGIFRARAEVPLSQLAEGRDWRMCEALLTLHAIADEACAGLGLAADASGAAGLVYRAQSRELLATSGSLARLPPHRLRVLPRVRTPTSGSSVRALSRYAAVVEPGVGARWHKTPSHAPGRRRHDEAVNVLLLPWPLHVSASDFHPVAGPLQKLPDDRFGFFEFAPGQRLDLDLVDRTLEAAENDVETVDSIVLPESAIDSDEIGDLEALLGRHHVTTLITGVRGHPDQPGQFPRNWVHIGVSVGEQWVHIRQAKHHRWSLDEGQIHQYHLGGVLQPDVRWWEAVEVPRRTVQFVELGNGVTLASMVCEDLAQSDDVAALMRSVGPMIVMAPLLDGPQLGSRWAARYAGVLADDPGSAVLTLTSFGMAQRSRPPGFGRSPVVALWQSPGKQAQEIPLERGAHGVLLTARAAPAVKRSFDGRRPRRDGSEFGGARVRQVHGASPDPAARAVRTGASARSVLEPEELTILTSWAEAVADALAFAPHRIDGVLAAAHAGAPWRAEFGVPEPGTSLSRAIDGVDRAARTPPPTGGQPPLAALAHAVGDSRPDASALDRLVHAALRSALEQRQANQVDEGGDLVTSA